MNKLLFRQVILLLLMSGLVVTAGADSMTFDQLQWETGRMDEQYSSDSGGTQTATGVDYFYYYARLPMRMPLLDDSLSAGSSGRTYDSAILQIVVSLNGSVADDQMRIFTRRLTREWYENGVSWDCFYADVDSLWSVAGGDFNSFAASDTFLIDTSIAVGDSLYFQIDTGFVRLMIEWDNRGWLLMAENIVDRAVFNIYTEDEATASRRPKLTVYYTDGSAPDAIVARRRRNILSQGGL